MSTRTGIEWTDATWNPIRGCSRVSEGCTHCYAEKVAARFSGPGQPYAGLAYHTAKGQARWTGAVRVIPEHLADPIRWRRPRRIFVNSMSDAFHQQLDNDTIAALFGVMRMAPWHTFQVLTKRAKRLGDWFRWIGAVADGPIERCYLEARDRIGLVNIPGRAEICDAGDVWPLPNVWLGVSVEDQETADARIPLLLQTPAAVRFVSAEPLLGPVDLCGYLPATPAAFRLNGYRMARGCIPLARLPSLDWLVVGGESGGPPDRALVTRFEFSEGLRRLGWQPKPEPLTWVISLRDQCQAAGVPFFFKQWGGPRPTSGGRELEGRTWEGFPFPWRHSGRPQGAA